MKKIYSIIDFLFPPICGGCGKFDSNYLCSKCEKTLQRQAKFQIQKNNEEENSYQKHLYIFEYEGIIRKMILRYKFKEESFLVFTFVNFLLKNKIFFEILKSYDILIPIPISRKRMKQRGYNQSFLIAKEIAKQINSNIIDNAKKLKICNYCLLKSKNTKPQSTLNKQERLINSKGAYQLKNKKYLKDKKLLLIDDIYTTGSTVAECIKILKKAEIKSIDVFTIAKD